MLMHRLWFQIHWVMGISAGLVLAVVGITGAGLSFQTEILRGLNPGVLTVERQAQPPLTLPELLARIRAAHPDKRVTSLTVHTAPGHAARVTFAAPRGTADASASRRGETQYADPYTGQMLGKARGAEFFRTVMEVHRWLATGDVGKHVVGASTIALVLMCLSGLYLRWPRRALDLRAWLTFDVTRKGRAFLRHLHATVGTWMLVPYLVMGLTGLYWSYDWYRDALFAVTGAQRPVTQRGAAHDATAGAGQLAAAWAEFERVAGPYTSATLRLPERRQALLITYLAPGAPHDRAIDRIVLDMERAAVVTHERYADKAAGAKLMASMFALHSGSFFGVWGSIALMIASALMPLFAVTGWMLYLDRRSKKRRARVVSAPQAA